MSLSGCMKIYKNIRLSKKHRGGMSGLNPSPYDGKGVSTSGANLQLVATNY